MLINKKIDAFVKLGEKIEELLKNKEKSGKLDVILDKAEQQNGFFDRENVLFALKQWAVNLSEESILSYISSINSVNDKNCPKKIFVVAAGNIPLAVFHDFLSVLISNNILVGKLSSKDDILLQFIAEMLKEIDSDFDKRIFWSKQIVSRSNIDGLILTGSDNSARIFNYYFQDIPRIIRKNKTSIAVLNGKETEKELNALADDIFIYYGLGCRNVAKVFVPNDFDVVNLQKAIFKYQNIINNSKYSNNYYYQRTIFLMENVKFTDLGFTILNETENLHSPLSVLNIEKYKDIKETENAIALNKNYLQIIVSNFIKDAVRLGEAQKPKLTDFADGINTLSFLNEINC